MNDLSTPPDARDISDYQSLVDSIEGWTKGKTFGDVETFTTAIDGTFYAARKSIHSKPSFEEFKRTLFENHTENEAKYMHILTDYSQLDAPDPWKSYTVIYKMPFPLSKREFAIWILAVMVSEDEFLVISLPRTHDSSLTRGRYFSVESVKNTTEGVEWKMAFTSNAGGFLPMFLQRPALASTAAKDVGCVLEYMSKTKATQQE